MDFLNQALRRLATRWNGWSTGGRAASIVVCLAVGLAAVAWSRWRPEAALTELFGGAEFTAADLARMEAAFGKSRLGGARIEGRRVAVPELQKDLYLKALADHQALPDTFYSAQERAFDRDHPFVSQRQRDGWMKLAREQEIALIVRKIKGIEEVCVQYEDSETDGFPRRKRRRATVAVRAAEGRQVEPATVHAIRTTVMTAVGAAAAGDVTVLDLNAGRAYDGGDEDALRRTEDEYASAKHKYETFYQTKIEQRLAMYPGAVVTVNVELDRGGEEASDSAPLTPSDVAASIGLPRSLIVELWRRSRPEFGPRAARRPETFELRRLENELRADVTEAVAALLPGGAEEGVRSAVTVDSFADAPAGDATPVDGRFEWQTALVDKEWLIAVGLATIAAAAWQAGRRTGSTRDASEPDRTDATLGARRPAAATSAELADLSPADRRIRLRDQLAERVKDDPRSAAATLKQWIGNSA